MSHKDEWLVLDEHFVRIEGQSSSDLEKICIEYGFKKTKFSRRIRVSNFDEKRDVVYQFIVADFLIVAWIFSPITTAPRFLIIWNFGALESFLRVASPRAESQNRSLYEAIHNRPPRNFPRQSNRLSTLINKNIIFFQRLLKMHYRPPFFQNWIWIPAIERTNHAQGILLLKLQKILVGYLNRPYDKPLGPSKSIETFLRGEAIRRTYNEMLQLNPKRKRSSIIQELSIIFNLSCRQIRRYLKV